ncbi:putative ribonuclease H-like domain-containing protein [Tanacetum coccineum]
MNYQQVSSENQANKLAGPKEANHNVGTEDIIDAGNSEKEAESAQDYFVLPIWSSYSSTVKRSTAKDAGEAPNKHPDLKTDEKLVDKEDQVFFEELEKLKRQEHDAYDAAEALRKEFAKDTEDLLFQPGAAKASSTNIVNTASTPVSTASSYGELSFTDLTNTDQDDSEIPALEEIYANPTDGIFTNSSYDDEGAVADFTNLEPVVNASPIPTSRINSIHPSTLILGDLKSLLRSTVPFLRDTFQNQQSNKDERRQFGTNGFTEIRRIKEVLFLEIRKGLVAQGQRQRTIDMNEMDVKSAFLYGKIDEEVYVSQPLGFIDPKYPQKVYKVVKALYGITQAPRASRSWCDEFETLLKSRFQMSSMGGITFFLGLQVKQKEDGIFISQDKYVAEILKKFDFVNIKTASTPIETQKPLVKDEEASDMDVHLYRSMIGSLMYLTASRPDIKILQFSLPPDCACSRSVSTFDLEAYSDSDYAGSNLDRKSTTGGCQFLGKRLIFWQCKKQTIMATSTTEAEYVAAANCCGQVLWIQNQIFEMSAKSNLINKVRYITAKSPAGKPVSISEASIRSDLLAIFDAIKLMGNIIFDGMMRHLDAKKKLVMYPKLKKPVPLDHFPINALTSKVFSFMVKKGKHFSRNVTPLFDSIMVQPTKDEGDTLETHSEPQPIPSLPYPSTYQHKTQTNPFPRPSPTTHITDSILKGSGGNHGGQSSSDRSLSGNEGGMTLQSVYDLCISLCTHVTDQAKEIKHLKAQIKKLKKKAKRVITHHRAWMKSVSMKQRLAGKKSLKKLWMQMESVSKQGRKPAKAEPTVHKDLAFDELDDDAIDYMKTEDAQDVGRTRYVVHEEKESAEKKVSTEDALSTAQPKVSIDKEEVSTGRPDEGTDKQKVSNDKEELSIDRPDEGTVDQTEGRSATPTTPTPTPTTFGDDETIAQVLLNMSQAKAVSREKEKGVELKDVENIERPRPTSTRSLLTLKPLPKIDPKDKGKKKIEEDESDTESEDINESEKKFKMLAHDEEIARKMQEDWEAEEERKRLAEEEATNAALIQDFDDIKARIEADRLLALRLQEEEREQFTMEERAKFLHDTIAAQRRFLAEQRAAAIRNRPPTRTQLRSQMMTYLKHVGNKKHSDLKNKTFEEIQALYEKVKRFDESFTVIGSNEDERKIKELNEGASDPDKKKKFVKEDVLTKVPAKPDVAEQGTKKRKGGHMKMLARKRKRPQSDVDSDDEHIKCLKIVTFEGTIDSEIMERKSVITRLNKVSSPDGDYLVIYRANGNFRAFNYLLEVLHIFDRQDLFHLYELVMKQYSEVTMEGIELILWGDLKIMMESSKEENDQKLEDGTIIHMLVERRYPLSKDLMQRMLDLGLEVERESTVALDLIRFIKQQLNEEVLNSPCFMVKSWLVQDQTVLGKDYSNLLIADSLLKTIWFINAPCYGNEALASPKANELTIPEQMATGKGISNPFMAGSLPKTTKPT